MTKRATKHRQRRALEAAVERLLLRAAAREHLWLCQKHGLSLRQAYERFADRRLFPADSLRTIAGVVRELAQEAAGGRR